MENFYFYAGEIQVQQLFNRKVNRLSGVESYKGTPEDVYKEITNLLKEKVNDKNARVVFTAFNIVENQQGN